MSSNSPAGRYDAIIDGYVAPQDSPEGRKTALDLLRAWSNGIKTKDLEGLRALMHPEIVIELPFNESGKTDQASYRIYRGVQACVEFWAVAFKAEGQMHDQSETELSLMADGSRLFLETRGHLTMSDGKEYRNRYVMRMDFRDGKVLHCKEYYNPIQSAYAFGRPVAGKYMIDAL